MITVPADVSDAVTSAAAAGAGTTAAAGFGCSSGDRAALKAIAADSTAIGVRSATGTTTAAATVAAVIPAVINDRADPTIATPHSLLGKLTTSVPVHGAWPANPLAPCTGVCA